MKFAAIGAAFLSLVCVVPAVAQGDATGCTDLFATRMSGYVIRDCDAHDFDAYIFVETFPEETRVEGKVSINNYFNSPTSRSVSVLQVRRYYEQTLAQSGWTVVHSDADLLVEKKGSGGQQQWLELEGNGGDYYTLALAQGTATPKTPIAAANSSSSVMAAPATATAKVATQSVPGTLHYIKPKISLACTCDTKSPQGTDLGCTSRIENTRVTQTIDCKVTLTGVLTPWILRPVAPGTISVTLRGVGPNGTNLSATTSITLLDEWHGTGEVTIPNVSYASNRDDFTFQPELTENTVYTPSDPALSQLGAQETTALTFGVYLH